MSGIDSLVLLNPCAGVAVGRRAFKKTANRGWPCKYALIFCCIAGYLFLATGCDDSNLPPLAPVTGRITYRGQPLPAATVTFNPGSDARAATALTDADGRYTLGTYSISDGAVHGKHRVTIVARGAERPLKPGERGSGIPGEMMPGEPVIPKKYFTPETSGLEFEVVRGKNVCDLTLAD